jgi:hypothetical protein
MRQRRPVTLLLAWLVLIATAPVAAAKDNRITADLDGTPIAASSSSAYYCHDFDYPRIHCFRSAEDLQAAVGVTSPTNTALLSAASVPVGTWVIVFSDASYAGSYAYLSHNYDRLGDIGWNDRISSFSVNVGISGFFAQNVFGSGWGYNWCCYQNIPYVGSSFNDQFSSFYRS